MFVNLDEFDMVVSERLVRSVKDVTQIKDSKRVPRFIVKLEGGHELECQFEPYTTETMPVQDVELWTAAACEAECIWKRSRVPMLAMGVYVVSGRVFLQSILDGHDVAVMDDSHWMSGDKPEISLLVDTKLRQVFWSGSWSHDLGEALAELRRTFEKRHPLASWCEPPWLQSKSEYSLQRQGLAANG